MRKGDRIMTAEEFFGGTGSRGGAPTRSCRPRRKMKAEDLFEEAKTQMVMRINGVSRAKALEIIAARTKKAGAGDESGDRAAGSDCDDGLMSAEAFFGGV